MEGFQAKENNSVERKAKEIPFEFRQEIREADSRGLEHIFWNVMSQVKQSAKVMVWGGMAGHGFTKERMHATHRPNLNF